MIRISKHQLFCLIMLFDIGSTSLFILGSEAGTDAWIAVLLGTAGGLGLIWSYTKLQKIFPNNNITQIIIRLLGKPLGVPLVILYGLYFFYKSGIILREFSELILMSYLPRTPVIYISITLMLIIAFMCYSGLEVLGRSSEISLPIVLFFILMTYILVIASGRVHPGELTPILSNGIIPVINASYPRILNFPFGESFAFFMYWSYLNSKEAVMKTSILASLASGLLITTSAIIITSTLGIEFAENSTIPLLQVIKLINIGDILTNLDAIGVTIIFIGGFYKITIFFYAFILVLNELFKTQNNKLVTIIVGILVTYFSYSFVPSYQFSLWLGKKIHPFLMNTPLLVFSPILLLGIAYTKTKLRHTKL